jgi:hypothetical protein
MVFAIFASNLVVGMLNAFSKFVLFSFLMFVEYLCSFYIYFFIFFLIFLNFFNFFNFFLDPITEAIVNVMNASTGALVEHVVSLRSMFLALTTYHY